MGFILLLIMIVVPIIEIAVFIQAGDVIGLWPTLGVIILTAILGTSFIRVQGLGVIRRVQECLARGDMPVREMFDGLCLLVAGALLLTPGFITDGVGLVLLIPPLRYLIATQFVRHLIQPGHPGAPDRPDRHDRHDRHDGVIDGDFEDITQKNDENGDARPRLPRQHDS